MSERFKRLSHSIYECKYHIMFCPKYRYKIFKEDVAEYAKQQIYRLCEQKEMIEGVELMIVSIPMGAIKLIRSVFRSVMCQL